MDELERKCSNCVWYGSGSDGHKWQDWCEGKSDHDLEGTSFGNAENCAHYIPKNEKGWNQYKETLDNIKGKELDIIKTFITTNVPKAAEFIYNIVHNSWSNKKRMLEEMRELSIDNIGSRSSLSRLKKTSNTSS